MYNEDVRMIRCQATEKATDEGKRLDAEWMEWHANALAPRIQMPRKPFKQKAAELIALLKKSRQTDNAVEIMPMVIMELSDFFGVSIQAAKIRMIDVGYTEAIGMFEYVDDHRVPAHAFTIGSIGKNQTYSVPVADSIIEYAFNNDFRRMMDSGNFIYIDSHFCINDPKYVVRNEFGINEMTEYAIQNMDECCPYFDRTTRPNKDFGVNRYTECVLFQNAVSKTLNDFKYSHTDRNKEVETRAATIRAEQIEVKEVAKILEKLPATFHQSLIMLLEWRGITIEQLAEKALLSDRTIRRLKNEPDYKCSLKTALAICFGLQLHPHISDSLIAKAGYNFRVGEEGVTYSHLLATRYQGTIHEVNEYLETVGFPRLSGEE
jgi:DNA-binding XRE family transcriptional regulator